MPLCEMCKAIPDNFVEDFAKLGWRHFYIHHPTVEALYDAAMQGCNVCSLLRISFIKYLRWLDTEDPSGYYPHQKVVKDASTLDTVYTGTSDHTADNNVKFSVIFEKGELFLAYTLVFCGGDGLLFKILNAGSSTSYELLPLHQSNFDLASGWIKECAGSHSSCCARYDVTFMPTRLIDVGEHGQSPPRLVENKTIGLENSPYLALSHCWGTSMPESATTKSSTLARRLEKIPIKSLPRTFRDAITTARRLKVRYLWIDSLCIVQDDAADWQKESALMGRVYSHSYCVLAAASSPDCHGGLFPPQDEIPMLYKKHTLLLSNELERSKYLDLDSRQQNDILKERGWTLQETELAPRILHFTKHQVYYECREAIGLRGLHTRNSQELGGGSDELLLSKGPDDFRFLDYPKWRYTTELYLKAWRKMIENFSSRYLTRASDRFPAMSGLATEYAFLLNDRYVAGLWLEDLARGLLWFRDGSPSEWQAKDYGPSWSWAKINGPITYERGYFEWDASWNGKRGHAIFDKVLCVPEGSDPNGTLVSAYIYMRAYLFPIHRRKGAHLGQITDAYAWEKGVLDINWDFFPRVGISYTLLYLGFYDIGLVLEDGPASKSKNDLKRYRRVGLWSMDFWKDRKIWLAGRGTEFILM